ncbi:MAG: GNAT family N-acetyltransferase [Candidatus Bathyarchaeota archaeon]|nr:GNAT family N-acetyltransferase [Candidatus Bathyarchaeota archaeon]
MLEFIFEPLRKSDVDVCVKMVISTLGSQAKAYGDENTIKRMIYGSQVMTFVAKKKEGIVGLINGTLLGFPRIMFLTVVDEQSAREGLGGMLIDQFVKEIKKSSPNVKCVLHNEFADNFNAVGLYSVKGFKVTGYIKDPITSRNVVFMEKVV